MLWQSGPWRRRRVGDHGDRFSDAARDDALLASFAEHYDLLVVGAFQRPLQARSEARGFEVLEQILSLVLKAHDLNLGANRDIGQRHALVARPTLNRVAVRAGCRVADRCHHPLLKHRAHRVLEPLGLYLARQRPGGGEIVYSAPGYTALIDSAAPLGGRGIPVPLDARLENDLPALARAITDKTLAVSLVNPHNPSGTTNETPSLHRFIEESARRTLVVVDEAYLEYDAFDQKSAIAHVRAGRNVLVFRTLAKIYGLAGLAIGYAVAPAELARGLRNAGIGAPHSLTRPALAAAAVALADQTHVQTVRCATLAQRETLNALIDRRGWRRTDSRANFVFFQPPRPEALRDALKQAGIDIARPFPPLDDWLRITIGRPAENARVLALLRSWR